MVFCIHRPRPLHLQPITMLFHRGAASSQEGKCVDRIDVPLPETVKLDLIAVARLAGNKTPAEYVRGLIYTDLYGKLSHVRTLLNGSSTVDGMNTGGLKE